MLHCFDPIRDMTFWAILARLTLAVVCGGLIGAEREVKRRPAGFRTHILICLGSAITTLTSQYLLFQHLFNDIARLGAQVISGIGFVGAGTIIVTRDKRVKGLTTAAGLWASACVGLAIGAGFYECVIPAFLLVFAVVKLLPYGEDLIIENLRNINLYMEYDKLEHTGKVVDQIRKLGVQIYEIEIDRRDIQEGKRPSAVFTLRLKQKIPHDQVLAHISALECISSIEEI